MNQVKIGEYITKLRKEKGLTQEELGEKLGISDKSVSKWERGIHLPDLNNLVPLADFLGTNVNDLLNGGVSDLNGNSKSDEVVVNNIKVYTNKYKKKYAFMFFSFIIVVILLISSIFFFNNYNKNKVYYLSGLNNFYYANGYLIVNPERNILIIRNIEYNGLNANTDVEPELISINISTVLNDMVLNTYSNDMVSHEPHKISDVLKNTSIVVDDSNIKNLNVDEKTQVKMIIEYIDTSQNYEINELIFELNKIFASNKIVYN